MERTWTLAPTKRAAQLDYAESLVRYEFEIQGFRGGIKPDVQIRAAADLFDRAVKAGSLMTFDVLARKAVERVRTAKLANVAPSMRTVTACNCGKPKAPHTTEFHS